ncbi:hypothetical protein KVV02_003632 [Mortierella alpina]|uniref:Arrestin C-terminal-like domain-containing protein n=1 Tax=Mortierella alpina TaxID=64518 RepID=A0A9P8A8J3_MORAP|nr:hypothetical protein KVV02_003632 [Mortierella alpina]
MHHLPMFSFFVQEGKRSVVYSIYSVLSFETQPGNVATRASVSSTPVKVHYLPRTRPAAVDAPMHETRSQIELCSSTAPSDSLPRAASMSTGSSSIQAVLKTRPSVFMGESIAMVLQVTNESHVDLQSIHLALVRQISYQTPHTTSTASISPPPSPPSHPWSGTATRFDHNVYTYTSPESTTVHSATIPIAKVVNGHSSWTQQLQFRLPHHLGLLPSIDKTVTPWLKIDYYIMVSIPIPQRHNSLVSRLTSGSKKRPFMDMSVFDTTEPHTTQEPSLQQPRQTVVERSLSAGSLGGCAKSPHALQLGPVPIVISAVPTDLSGRRFKWPIPNHLEVQDKPTFVRDRFEEEMVQHLSSLESLIMEDDDPVEVISLIHPIHMGSPSSSDDSDDDHADGRVHSRVPARFRHEIRALTDRKEHAYSRSGLGTPPPSPPQAPAPAMDDIRSLRLPNGLRGDTQSLGRTSRWLLQEKE